jgi:hypothetical protein
MRRRVCSSILGDSVRAACKGESGLHQEREGAVLLQGDAAQRPRTQAGRLARGRPDARRRAALAAQRLV